MNRALRPEPPRLALGPDEPAAALSVSRDFFDAHILSELSVVRRGRRILIRLSELEKWLAHNEHRLIP